MPFFLIFALLASFSSFAAEKVQPFVSGSLSRIAAERENRPFVLAFWSVTCTHCPAELRALGRLKKQYPRLDVVLVAADSPEDSPRVAELARSFGLGSVPQWVFADEVPERLRYEIDRRWYGELPRTHFYNRQHEIEAVSGVVPPERLARWVRENNR